MRQSSLEFAGAKDSFRLPAAPLRHWLRAKSKDLHEDVPGAPRAFVGRYGMNHLARLYAQRYLGSEDPEKAERQLYRIMHPDTKTISSITADRWCVLIGIHPMSLWPEEWMRGKVA